MKRNFISALLAIAILLSLATPAFAASEKAPTASCKYGIVLVKNPQTQVITSRCKTAYEYYWDLAKSKLSKTCGKKSIGTLTIE